MPIDQNILKRLSIIKYLYGLAIDQSIKPDPLCTLSILTFHDSIELFLQLSAEYLGKTIKSDIPFMGYWDEINSKLNPDQELTQKAQMSRFNKARVNLKHYGNLPSKYDLESYRATITNFFIENTIVIFGLEFNDINMAEAIHSNKIRESIAKAIKYKDKNDTENALKNVSIAFKQLLLEYTKSNELFNEISDPDRYFVGRIDQLQGITRQYIEKHETIMKKLVEKINDLTNYMKFSEIGIDMEQYIRFKKIAPEVYYVEGIGFKTYYIHPKISMDQVIFCIDFVISTALLLQDTAKPIKINSEFD